MSVAGGKLEGVRELEVSLHEGLARVELVPGNRVRLDDFRRIVLDNGFTPREARIVARGVPLREEGELRFRVTGPEAEIYRLPEDLDSAAREALEARLGESVWLRGVVPVPDPEAPGPPIVEGVELGKPAGFQG